MVTFEEMNLPVPKPKHWPSALFFALNRVALEKGFVRGVVLEKETRKVLADAKTSTLKS